MFGSTCIDAKIQHFVFCHNFNITIYFHIHSYLKITYNKSRRIEVFTVTTFNIKQTNYHFSLVLMLDRLSSMLYTKGIFGELENTTLLKNSREQQRQD